MKKNIAVLVLTYNRPHHLHNTLDRLLDSPHPVDVYVSADGPKDGIDKNATQQIANIIKTKKYSKLIVKYQIASCNNGLQAAVSGGIDWFFKHVEEGLILEDDLVFSNSFIPFCTELLAKYRDDDRVMMISGSNFFHEVIIENSYTFSQHSLIWGWATWRNCWQKYHQTTNDADQIISNQLLLDNLKRIASKQRVDYAVDALQKKLDSWAYIWGLAMYLHRGLCVIPQTNLIKNVGFGKNSTHTKIKTFHADTQIDDHFVIKNHPKYLIPNYKFDQLLRKYDQPFMMLMRTVFSKII